MGNCNITAPRVPLKDDHGGGGLQDLAQAATFEQQACENSAQQPMMIPMRLDLSTLIPIS